MLYKLVGKEAVPCEIMEWVEWISTVGETARIVKKTDLPGGVHVSTVFLGVSSPFFSEHPFLFETMVFGGEYDRYVRKYYTWEEAEAGHEETIQKVFDVDP